MYLENIYKRKQLDIFYLKTNIILLYNVISIGISSNISSNITVRTQYLGKTT